MKKFELLIQNCTIGLNQNIAFDTIDELKEQLKGMEFIINGGLYFRKRLIKVGYVSSFENVQTMMDLLTEDPDLDNAKILVLNQLKLDFEGDLSKAVEFYNSNFYNVCHDLETFGREHAETIGFEIPEHIEPYFDYERFAISEALNYKRIDNHLFHFNR